MISLPIWVFVIMCVASLPVALFLIILLFLAIMYLVYGLIYLVWACIESIRG